MENISIDTSQNVSLDFKLAGIGDRILARIIDGAILIFYIIIIVSTLKSNVFSSIYIYYILVYFPYLTYHLIFEIFFNGQSLGKMVMKIRVVSIDGIKPPISSFIIRWAIGIFEVVLTSGLGALLAIIISGKGQRVGDMLAKTTVIKIPNEADISETIFRTVKEDHKVTFPEVEKLSEEDINIINEMLVRLKPLEVSPKIKNAGKKLLDHYSQKMNVEVDGHPYWFFKKVIDDYNFINGKL